jgi:hypothetical protein
VFGILSTGAAGLVAYVITYIQDEEGGGSGSDS